MKSLQNKKTLIEFNYLRAIGITLVVLGHSFPFIDDITSPVYKYIHSLIYSFHMPLFFFISGFFATRILHIKSLEQYLKLLIYKFKKLMVPYFIISSLTIPIKLILNKFSERPIVLSQIIKDILFYPWNNPIIFFWFIYVLFLIFIFSPIIVKINKIIILTIFIILSIFPINNIEFMGISTTLKYSIFFFIGLYLNPLYLKYRDSILDIKFNFFNTIIVFLIPAIVFIMNLNMINYAPNILSSCIVNIFYFLKCILGIYISFIISIFIYKSRHIKLLSSTLNTLCKYSFDIYLLSWFPQIFIRILFLQILNLNYNIVVILSFICGFIPIVISKFIIRKYKILKTLILGIV